MYMVVDACRLLAAGAVTVLGGFELWKDGDISLSGPSAIAVMLLLLASLAMIPAAGFALAYKNLTTDTWQTVEHNQMFASALALLLSAVYAGLVSEGNEVQFDERPGIILLLLGVMKAVEHVARVFETSDQTALSGVAMQRLELNTKQAALSLLLSFGILLGASLSVDKQVPDFEKGETLYDDRLVRGILLGAVILLPAVIVLTAIIQKCTDMDGHKKVNQIASLLVYVALVLLAVRIGATFFPDGYPDKLYLAANFWYLAALSFGAMGAVQLEGYEPSKKQKSTTGSITAHGVSAIFFLGAVTTALFWSADTLYDELKDQTLVEVDNKTLTKGAQKQDVALSLYALMIVIVLASHVILSKVIDMILISGVLESVKPCCDIGLFSVSKKTSEDDLTPKRAEENLVYALVTAIFFATQSGSEWDVSVSIVFFIILAARFVQFYSDNIAGKEETCSAFFWDKGKAKQLSYQEPGVLMGIIALLLSAVSASVYVWTNTLPWDDQPEHVVLAVFEFVSLMLIYVHVLLTIIGCFADFHAGAIPILRFGVSSVVLLTFAWSLGERAFADKTYTLVTPTLLLYLAYDSNADELF